MIKFSIIYNSKRPFEEFGEKCILPITSFHTDIPYEIIFCHNTNIEKKYNNVKFINYRDCSSVEALNMMSSIAKGECLIYLNDAVYIGNRKEDHVQFFEYISLMNEYLNTLPKFQISSVRCGYEGNNLPCGINASTHELSMLPTLRGQICRFPIITKKSLEKELHGKIFNPSFIHHWVDNWLGFYCAFLNHPIIEHYPNNFSLKVNNHPDRIKSRKTDSDFYDYQVLLKLIRSFNLKNPEYTKLV